MFKHYITSAIRLIKRRLFFSVINMTGFVLGITATFLIYLWIVDEMTFEDFHKNKDSIYRVVEVSASPGGEIIETASTAAQLAEVFRNDFTSIKNATLIKYEAKHSYENDGIFAEGMEVYVDAAFFDLFSFPIVEGEPTRIGQDPYNIVLSEHSAKKLFGKEPATGKQIKLDLFNNTHYFTVVGVVKVPRKSHMQFEFVRNFDSYDGPKFWEFRESVFVYIQTNDNHIISGKERKAMSSVLTKHSRSKNKLYFQPLTDIHLYTKFVDQVVPNYGNMMQIYLFGFLAILIIFMGVFNFVTLSTAQASLRYKEVGVRKVTGAKQKKLITQFLSESTVQAFFSLVLSLALTELLLPLFNRITDKDISLVLSWQIIVFVFLGIFIVGCLAGSYPAFYLSAVNPLLAFKGGQKTGRKGKFIKILVCIQFTIAFILILCTSLMFKQLNYMKNKNLGYEKENIISINTNLWYGVDAFKQEVLKNPNVLHVAMGADISDYLQGYSWQKVLMTWDTTDGRTDSLQMVQMFADGDFISTYGMEIVKGEVLKSDFDTYWKHSSSSPVMINETAWKLMKVEDPVGMPIRRAGVSGIPETIVGVVKDFNFQSLKESIKPLFIGYNPEALVYLHIKIIPENQQETLKFLEDKYTEFSPPTNKVFSYRFFTDALNDNYAREQQQYQILFIFTILAIIIAMLGVFGLVSLSTQQRTKEIGVRKVIGARTNRIIRMFCKEYLIWLAAAFIIACPVAYILMHNWLKKFAYQTSLSWWLFPMAGLLIFTITLITVIAQTYHTASQNPVTSLRYE